MLSKNVGAEKQDSERVSDGGVLDYAREWTCLGVLHDREEGMSDSGRLAGLPQFHHTTLVRERFHSFTKEGTLPLTVIRGD